MLNNPSSGGWGLSGGELNEYALQCSTEDGSVVFSVPAKFTIIKKNSFDSTVKIWHSAAQGGGAKEPKGEK
jgi:hypothetical protein